MTVTDRTTKPKKFHEGQFINNKYRLIEKIGQGAYSVVWKATSPTQEHNLVAIKIIDRQQRSSTLESTIPIEKEILLHRPLNHPNIVKLFEVLEDDYFFYLIQEFCQGGELFGHIEPDVGFPPLLGHFYFYQLLRAVDYLHGLGICHRDIKPENILVDEFGNLKLSDFGLATLFQKGSIRRRLMTRCGTPLYMAPEVLNDESGYEGDEADLWSCAVVLFVMLMGCHPWEEPTFKCSFYKKFLLHQPNPNYEPWNRIENDCKSLLISMLRSLPKNRLTLKRVFDDPWVAQINPLFNQKFQCENPTSVAILFDSFEGTLSSENPSISFTQPVAPNRKIQVIASQKLQPKKSTTFLGFSQPIFSNSPSNSNDGGEVSENIISTRLTRFFVPIPSKQILFQLITKFLDEYLIPWRLQPLPNQISFQTVDKRKNPIVGEIMAVDVSEECSMVVFRKTRGDCLEFRRLFRLVHNRVAEEAI